MISSREDKFGMLDKLGVITKGCKCNITHLLKSKKQGTWVTQLRKIILVIRGWWAIYRPWIGYQYGQ